MNHLEMYRQISIQLSYDYTYSKYPPHFLEAIKRKAKREMCSIPWTQWEWREIKQFPWRWKLPKDPPTLA